MISAQPPATSTDLRCSSRLGRGLGRGRRRRQLYGCQLRGGCPLLLLLPRRLLRLHHLPRLEPQRRLLLRSQVDGLPRLAVRAVVHLEHQQLVQEVGRHCSTRHRTRPPRVTHQQSRGHVKHGWERQGDW